MDLLEAQEERMFVFIGPFLLLLLVNGVLQERILVLSGQCPFSFWSMELSKKEYWCSVASAPFNVDQWSSLRKNIGIQWSVPPFCC